MSPHPDSGAFPAPEHDHERCLKQAMARARDAFEAKGLKFTPLRTAVFRELAASHRAIGAYEVLETFAARGERLAPISVYRALDALLAAGLVHRFESRNAFFACHAVHGVRPLVLACEACGCIAEMDAHRVVNAIHKSADTAAFAAKDAVIEVWGLCAACGAERESADGRP